MTERDDESNVGYECGRGKDHLLIFAWLLVLKSEKGEMAKSHTLIAFFLRAPGVYAHVTRASDLVPFCGMCVFMREKGEKKTKKKQKKDGHLRGRRLFLDSQLLVSRQLLLALSFLPRSLLFDQRS